MRHPHCQWCADNVAWLNVWGNVGLMIVKFLSGFFGTSWAVIADAVHSLADVATSLFVYISLKLTNKPPDKNFPYGYGHIEFVASGLIGVFLFLAGFLIIWSSITALISGDFPFPGMLAIAGEVVSIVGNELMFRHGICAARQVDSPAIFSNAWENRMDAWTSSAALAGVVGARLGLHFLDAVAALVVAGCIVNTAIWMIHLSTKGLMDSSLDKKFIGELHKIASSVQGVRGVKSLKARKSGQKIWVDMEVCVDPESTIGQAKNIKERIRESILERIERVGNVAVIFHSAI